MLGLRYLKSNPTTHVMLFKSGNVVTQGAGLSFWYFAPNSVIVQVNLATQDLPFVFEQSTADFQEVTIQGNLAFRVVDPTKLTSQLDFSIDTRGRYASDDPNTLQDRLVRSIQVECREFIRERTLADVLFIGTELGERLSQFLSTSEMPQELGMTIESVEVLSVKPTPEMQTALQAEAREATLQKADRAVHERRKLAIEAEQEIRERELQNEKIVQEKQREIRETELAADVAIEQGRAELVQRQAENEKVLASARAESMKESFAAMQGIDWKTISALSGNADSKDTIAMAFAQMAENANKIGRLDISPDLLRQLTDGKES